MLLPLYVLGQLAGDKEMSTGELGQQVERFVTFPGFMGYFLPMLHDLEARSMLASRWVPLTSWGKRKLYRLGPSGMAAYRHGVQEASEVVDEVLAGGRR